MWPLVVVLGLPCVNAAPCFTQVAKPAGVEALVPEAPVETFHMAVLHGFARLNVNRSDAPVPAPGQIMPAGDFRAVVRPQKLRSATLFDDVAAPA